MILINLIPAELRRKEAAKIVLPEIPVKKTLLVVAGIVLGVQLLMSVAAIYFSLRYKMVQHETQALSDQLGDLRRVKDRIEVLSDKVKELRALTGKKFYWAKIMNELTMTATRGVWLRSLGVEEAVVLRPSKETSSAVSAKSESTKRARPASDKYIVMKMEGSCAGGSGQETALIGKYLKALRESAYFKEVFGDNIDLSNINQRKVGQADVFDFTVQCRFKKEKT